MVFSIFTIVISCDTRATKLIPGFKELSYEERLKKLHLPTLKYRRVRGDMIELYKILSGKYDSEVSNFIKLHKKSHDTRGHQYKIEKQFIRLNIRKYSFIHRSVDLWNNLPTSVVSARTIHSFESRLDKLWKDQPFKYDINNEIPTQKLNLELTLEAIQGLQSEEDL